MELTADKDAKFGINLLNWLIDPISDLISLIRLGSFKFLIASDFCIRLSSLLHRF